MNIERINPNGRYHEAIIAGDMIYMSGKVCEGDTVAEQTEGTLAKIEEALARFGSDKEHILAAACYLSDISTFAEFNSVWDAWVTPGKEPTRTCVEAKLAAPKYMVEITVTAIKAE